MDKIPLSVIIPAYNEEAMIGEALASVSWASEIVVVDNGSDDRTVEIAKKAGARVVKCMKDGIDYSKPRNLGAKEASREWLLYLDADERATDKLKDELERTINDPEYSAYSLPRQNIFLGHPMRHGGWWPDRVLRLIKKSELEGWHGHLHEQPKIKGRIGALKNPLIHHTHRNLSEMLNKTNRWSVEEAKLLYQANHPRMVWWRFISVAFREFWYRGVLKLGFLDGTVGVIEIIYQMFSRMITYAKLWEMQQKDESRNI